MTAQPMWSERAGAVLGLGLKPSEAGDLQKGPLRGVCGAPGVLLEG